MKMQYKPYPLKPFKNLDDEKIEEEILIRNNNNYLVYLFVIKIALIFLIIFLVIKIKKKAKQDDINRSQNVYKKNYEMWIKEYKYSFNL